MNRQCCGIQSEFNDRVARRDLRTLRKRGTRKTTRILINAVSAGARGKDVLDKDALDIGGGVGAVQLALCAAGFDRIVSVDASSAYLSAAKQEAHRQGFANRVTYIEGDFVEVADAIEPAAIVTLDRVLCCYDDVRSLVEKSAAKARHVYGVVYPRLTPLSRLVFGGINFMMWATRSNFRSFLHDPQVVDGLIRQAGLRKRKQVDHLLWQVVVYDRQ